MVCRFCCPTSTTPQLAVAAQFSQGDGIILELEKYSNTGLRYFNCSLLSGYSNEDERLFFGGFYELSIRSVRDVSKSLDYRHYIRILSLFDQAIEGQRHRHVQKMNNKGLSDMLTHF